MTQVQITNSVRTIKILSVLTIYDAFHKNY